MFDKKNNPQEPLFESPESWEKEWQNMPEFVQEDLTPFRSVVVHFEKKEDVDAFAKLLEQKITEDTKSLWYPKMSINRYVKMKYEDES